MKRHDATSRPITMPQSGIGVCGRVLPAGGGVPS